MMLFPHQSHFASPIFPTFQASWILHSSLDSASQNAPPYPMSLQPKHPAKTPPVPRNTKGWNLKLRLFRRKKTLVSGANVKFQGGYKNPAYEIYAPYCRHKGGKHVRKICGFPKPFRPKFSLATEI